MIVSHVPVAVRSQQRLTPFFVNARQRLGFERCQSTKTSTLPSRIVSWYANKLETHPLLTKCVSSGLIAASGDFLCQVVVDRRKKKVTTDGTKPQSVFWWWDSVRTGRFLLLGTILVAPAIHYWYGALATTIAPGLTVRAVAKRVAWDQFVFTPLFLVVWLTSLWSLEVGGPAANVDERLATLMPPVLLANWSLWIPLQAVNFRLVPLKFQVLFSNVVAVAWNFYLSYSTSSAKTVEVDVEYETL